jgi:transcription factor SFP1
MDSSKFLKLSICKEMLTLFRYHKTHGHQTQQLHDNADGTFSIVNPETSAPYPGTLGMEKEKPYKCDVCGKRYKNLNGLKYVS